LAKYRRETPMWPTICPMLHPASPPTAGGRHAAAAGGSAATSRSVRCRTLSKKRRYDAISVITSTSSSCENLAIATDEDSAHATPRPCHSLRSEERRVGKECRSE